MSAEVKSGLAAYLRRASRYRGVRDLGVRRGTNQGFPYLLARSSSSSEVWKGTAKM
jgi:hypothetical protein